MLWNLGLAGYFHPVLYGLAAAAAAYVAYQAWRYGDHTTLVGIGLLIAGGIGLHSTWQSALTLAGIVLLARPLALIGSGAKPGREERIHGSASRADWPRPLNESATHHVRAPRGRRSSAEPA